MQVSLKLPQAPQVTGLADSQKFNSQLDSYIDLKNILGDKILNDNSKQDDFEKIIEWSTVFEDSRIYKTKLHEIDWLTEKQITDLTAHRYQGWGRLSKKLLIELKNKNNKSILDLMWETQRTFMELQSQPEFAEQIANANQDKLTNDNYEDVLEDAYTSPQNKKAIRQVIKVVDDIVKAAGKAPRFISLEFARSDERSERKDARKTKIQEIYDGTAKELIKDDHLRDELANVTDLSNRLYLYFTQLGRDMYTGKPINIDEISTMYDIDHILPQAFIKDDSLDNRVLVRRQINNAKSDTVPTLEYAAMKPFWNKLQKHGLISKQKLNNLLTNPESIDKFKAVGFVNRQLVETRQVIKLAANILAKRYPNTKIIEVKASLTHQMRDSFNLIKNRDVNDYHHAFDGYLSAFIGQYLYNRYPKLQSYFVYGQFKKFDKQSSQIEMKTNHFNFLYDLEPGKNKREKIINKSTGEIIANRHELEEKLRKVYKYRPIILQEVYTRSGAMFDQTIYAADSGKKLIPLKKNKPTKIYGGYSGSKDAYLAIIKLCAKKGDKYQVVGIPVRAVTRLNQAKKKGKEEYLAQLKEIITPKLAKEKTNRKTKEKIVIHPKFEIIIPKVMYRQLIVDGDQMFTLGSSTYQYNARQLVLSFSSVEALSKDFIKNNVLTNKDKNSRLIEVYDEILEKVNDYFSLYDKNKFRQRLNEGRKLFVDLPLESKVENNKKTAVGKVEILQNILIGLHNNAGMGNLKVLGITTPFGMMQTKNGIQLSPNACLIYQSPTGLFERKVYLNSIPPLK